MTDKIRLLVKSKVLASNSCYLALSPDTLQTFDDLDINYYYFIDYLPFVGCIIEFDKNDVLKIKLAFDVEEYNASH